MKERIAGTANRENRIYKQLNTGEKIEVFKEDGVYFIRVLQGKVELLKYTIARKRIKKEFEAVESVL